MDVIQNQEFLELPKEEVMELLSSDDLNVSCEEEIFKVRMSLLMMTINNFKLLV